MTGLAHALTLGVPVLVLAALARIERPGLRERMACLLAGIAAFVALLAANVVAARLGWWTFVDAPSSALGQPIDVVLGWAVLWGAVPTLARRVRIDVLLATFAMVDLAVMPRLAYVELGPNWMVGEVAVVLAVALPAVLLGRWTAQRRHLFGRAALQVAVMAVVLGWLAPATALAFTGDALAPRGGIAGWVGVQVVTVGALLAVAAVVEFARVGRGTPWPWDPPARIVTSGPYRFVGNPMQVGAVVLLVGEATWLGQWPLLALAVFGVAFSLTVARFHEDAALGARFGVAWTAWRAQRPWWLVRWRPERPAPAATPEPASAPATLWVARGCDPCEGVAGWLAGRRPVGLLIRPAQERPGGPPTRLTYAGPSLAPVTGVRAFARALEHLALPWALVGFWLGLPGIATIATILTDAQGLGPKELDACPTP